MLRQNFNKFVYSIISALLLLTGACAPSQTDGNPDQCPDGGVNFNALVDEQYTTPVPQVDEHMTAYLSQDNAPLGCAVGVMVDNEVYYLQGYGIAEFIWLPAQNPIIVPYTYATPQGVGSISKTITALAIMRLVDQGYIDLDDSVRDYLPQSLIAWEGVTIRDLLAHEAGFQPWPTWQSNLNTEAELQAAFPGEDHPGIHPRYVYWGYAYNTVPQTLAPGTGLYSNTGYTILGAVIDYVTSQPDFQGHQGYENYTFWNVGMAGPWMQSMCLDTYWREDDILNLATGYQKNSIIVAPNAVNPNGGPGGWRGPAGGWSMTIGDLTRLMIGINSNTKVSPAMKAEMVNSSVTPLNPTTLQPDTVEHTYGLGIWHLDNLDRPTLMHGGNIDGFTARYTIWPEQDFGVALMCNEEEASGMRQLTNAIAAEFLDNQSRSAGIAPTATDSPAAKVERYLRQLSEETGDPQIAADRATQLLAETEEGRRLIASFNEGRLDEARQIADDLLADWSPFRGTVYLPLIIQN